jgi:hypothetical protein
VSSSSSCPSVGAVGVSSPEQWLPSAILYETLHSEVRLLRVQVSCVSCVLGGVTSLKLAAFTLRRYNLSCVKTLGSPCTWKLDFSVSRFAVFLEV